MAVSDRHVVFVTRNGELGNGSVFLLYLVRWLRDTGTWTTELLSWEGGPTLDRFRYAGPVQVLDELNQWRPARLFEILRFRRVAQVLKGVRLRWWLFRRRSADLLYINGLNAASVLGFIRWPPARTVVHVHDQTDVERADLSAADRSLIVDRTDLFVAGTEEIASALAAELDIPMASVLVHEYFVAGDTGPLTSPDPPARADLGLGEKDVVVGSTGAADWWATPEQFVLVAWTLLHRRPDVPWRFLWIAEDPDDRVLWPFRHDLANAGVDDRTVIWSGEAPLDLLASMDVLVLSNRREPNDLLLFEAAGAGVPVVCTDNIAGGAPGDSARIVPYLDIDRLVDEVTALIDDPEQRGAAVASARATARRHHDVSVGATGLLARLGLDP